MWTTTTGGFDQAWDFHIYKPTKNIHPNPTRAEQPIVNSATNGG